ncbi:hypothetical protein RclHR1_00970010 [Rhizophagus clarus]|uniref:Hsp70 family protein n=1 Tax=Rhizophagus clarus TaxID=94130 RepID=A0A2Z6SR48_9GLOM|nr:hypothetical protein RclHR1_00970010 [Rhizophagus clarus]GES96675.1 hypothetical protein GLOIN_2v1705943 [Rhizophagus clarus]
MELLEKFEKLNNRLTSLLEENKELNQRCKNLQEENQVLKEKFNERDYKNLQEENKKLKQHILNLEKQKNEQIEIISQNLEEYKQKYKDLQEENKDLNEREKHFKQHIQNLEKQKNDQLEIFSQNLEKTLGKLGLDKLDKANENDTQTQSLIKENNKSLIDNYDDDSIDCIEDPSTKEAPKKRPTSSTKETVTKKELVDHHISGYSYSSSCGFGGDVQVVVGLDFGTTYSGFSYCHVRDPENIVTNCQWPGEIGQLKTNTALQYDDDYCNVELWGLPALSKRPNLRKNKNIKKPVELFKLHLGNLSENLKPKLPIEYKKAITDYLREIGKLIKDKVETRWASIDFHKNVLFVLTVPAEYSDKEKAIMRECAFNAGLIEEKYSVRLQFTAEPEAAAIYCMKNSLELHDLSTTGTIFMIVDCGGGTIDLTIHKLVGNNQLNEVTESTGDFCGSTFIDQEYIKFLRNKLGSNAIDSFRNEYYDQFQYMIQEFCRSVKLPFTGDDLDFSYELDIEEFPILLEEYVSQETMSELEENENLIKVNYDDVKAIFDPIINRIICY